VDRAADRRSAVAHRLVDPVASRAEERGFFGVRELRLKGDSLRVTPHYTTACDGSASWGAGGSECGSAAYTFS